MEHSSQYCESRIRSVHNAASKAGNIALRQAVILTKTGDRGVVLTRTSHEGAVDSLNYNARLCRCTIYRKAVSIAKDKVDYDGVRTSLREGKISSILGIILIRARHGAEAELAVLLGSPVFL